MYTGNKVEENIVDLPSGKLTPIKTGGPVKRKRPANLGKKTAAAPEPVAKKPKPRVAAKKATKALTKTPKFLCTEHKVAMVYSSDLGFWYCPDTGCNQTRKAQVGGDADTVTKVSGFPRLVVRNDKDGDPHYYLHYEAAGVMVELPFTAVVGHQVFARTMTPSVVVNINLEDFVFLAQDGSPIALADIRDR